jgi:hypothetical protein
VTGYRWYGDEQNEPKIEQDHLRSSDGDPVMFGIETLGGTAQAAVLVGVVLLEALLLYVGYGGLTRLLGPHVQRALGGK